MDKTSRFYFFTKTAVKLIVSFFIVGIAFNLIDTYLTGLHEISDTVIEVLAILVIITKVATMVGFSLIIIYFMYITYRYLSSNFYLVSKIPLHEAFYHGYMDLAYVYERLCITGDVSYDTKTRSVIIKSNSNDNTYHVLVKEYFGTILGDARSSNWYIASKKKKEYGRVQYKKKLPIMNPIEENKMIINAHKEKTGVTCINLVCITGLQRNIFKNDQINTVYEIESIIK